MKKNTKITATQNTTETAAQTSCPTMGETLAVSDILNYKDVKVHGNRRKIQGPLRTIRHHFLLWLKRTCLDQH